MTIKIHTFSNYQQVKSRHQCSAACTILNSDKNNNCLAFSLNLLPEGQKCSLYQSASTVDSSQENEELLKDLSKMLGPVHPLYFHFYKETSSLLSSLTLLTYVCHCVFFLYYVCWSLKITEICSHARKLCVLLFLAIVHLLSF